MDTVGFHFSLFLDEWAKGEAPFALVDSVLQHGLIHHHAFTINLLLVLNRRGHAVYVRLVVEVTGSGVDKGVADVTISTSIYARTLTFKSLQHQSNTHPQLSLSHQHLH